MEIELKSDGSRKEFRMIDTLGGHYGIVLETWKKQDSSILFLEDAEGDLCSYKAVRKVHEVNQQNKKEQMITAFRNNGWINQPR